MYCSHFGLHRPPFNNTPDPTFYFSTPDHEEALASLQYATFERKGFVLLTGEIGAGKTLVGRMFLRQVERRASVAVITHTNLDGRQLLSAICGEFELEVPPNATNLQLTEILQSYLLEQFAQNRHAVVLLDEAQNLPDEAFEQIRMLGNLEADDAKLLQVCILGQPELRERILQPNLRQLYQRLFRRFHLPALSRAQVESYILHRLRVAGAGRNMFTAGAIDRIFAASGGVPRVINQICDNALLNVYGKGGDTVDEVDIAHVLEQDGVPTHLPAAPTVVSASDAHPKLDRKTRKALRIVNRRSRQAHRQVRELNDKQQETAEQIRKISTEQEQALETVRILAADQDRTLEELQRINESEQAARKQWEALTHQAEQQQQGISQVAGDVGHVRSLLEQRWETLREQLEGHRQDVQQRLQDLVEKYRLAQKSFEDLVQSVPGSPAIEALKSSHRRQTTRLLDEIRRIKQSFTETLTDAQARWQETQQRLAGLGDSVVTRDQLAGLEHGFANRVLDVVGRIDEQKQKVAQLGDDLRQYTRQLGEELAALRDADSRLAVEMEQRISETRRSIEERLQQTEVRLGELDRHVADRLANTMTVLQQLTQCSVQPGVVESLKDEYLQGVHDLLERVGEQNAMLADLRTDLDRRLQDCDERQRGSVSGLSDRLAAQEEHLRGLRDRVLENVAVAEARLTGEIEHRFAQVRGGIEERLQTTDARIKELDRLLTDRLDEVTASLNQAVRSSTHSGELETLKGEYLREMHKLLDRLGEQDVALADLKADLDEKLSRFDAQQRHVTDELALQVQAQVEHLRVMREKLLENVSSAEARLADWAGRFAQHEDVQNLRAELDRQFQALRAAAEREYAGMREDQAVGLRSLREAADAGIKQLEEVQQDLAATLRQQGAAVQAQGTQLEAHQQAIDAHTQRLDGQDAAFRAAGERVDEHQQVLQEHAGAIARQESTLADHGLTLQGQASTLNAHSGMIDQYGHAIDAQADALRRQLAQLEQHTDTLARQETTLELHEHALRQQRDLIDTTRATVNEQAGTLIRHDAAFNEVGTTQRRHDETLQSHANTLQGHTGTLQSHADTLQGHTHALQGHTGLLEDHSSTLQSHADQLRKQVEVQAEQGGLLSNLQDRHDAESTDIIRRIEANRDSMRRLIRMVVQRCQATQDQLDRVAGVQVTQDGLAEALAAHAERSAELAHQLEAQDDRQTRQAEQLRIELAELARLQAEAANAFRAELDEQAISTSEVVIDLRDQLTSRLEALDAQIHRVRGELAQQFADDAARQAEQVDDLRRRLDQSTQQQEAQSGAVRLLRDELARRRAEQESIVADWHHQIEEHAARSEAQLAGLRGDLDARLSEEHDAQQRVRVLLTEQIEAQRGEVQTLLHELERQQQAMEQQFESIAVRLGAAQSELNSLLGSSARKEDIEQLSRSFARDREALLASLSDQRQQLETMFSAVDARCGELSGRIDALPADLATIEQLAGLRREHAEQIRVVARELAGRRAELEQAITQVAGLTRQTHAALEELAQRAATTEQVAALDASLRQTHDQAMKGVIGRLDQETRKQENNLFAVVREVKDQARRVSQLEELDRPQPIKLELTPVAGQQLSELIETAGTHRQQLDATVQQAGTMAGQLKDASAQVQHVLRHWADHADAVQAQSEQLRVSAEAAAGVLQSMKKCHEALDRKLNSQRWQTELERGEKLAGRLEHAARQAAQVCDKLLAALRDGERVESSVEDWQARTQQAQRSADRLAALLDRATRTAVQMDNRLVQRKQMLAAVAENTAKLFEVIEGARVEDEQTPQAVQAGDAKARVAKRIPGTAASRTTAVRDAAWPRIRDGRPAVAQVG